LWCFLTGEFRWKKTPDHVAAAAISLNKVKRRCLQRSAAALLYLLLLAYHGGEEKGRNSGGFGRSAGRRGSSAGLSPLRGTYQLPDKLPGKLPWWKKMLVALTVSPSLNKRFHLLPGDSAPPSSWPALVARGMVWVVAKLPEAGDGGLVDILLVDRITW
jgi:hypothetical protein